MIFPVIALSLSLRSSLSVGSSNWISPSKVSTTFKLLLVARKFASSRAKNAVVGTKSSRLLPRMGCFGAVEAPAAAATEAAEVAVLAELAELAAAVAAMVAAIAAAAAAVVFGGGLGHLSMKGEVGKVGDLVGRRGGGRFVRLDRSGDVTRLRGGLSSTVLLLLLSLLSGFGGGRGVEAVEAVVEGGAAVAVLVVEVVVVAVVLALLVLLLLSLLSCFAGGGRGVEAAAAGAVGETAALTAAVAVELAAAEVSEEGVSSLFLAGGRGPGAWGVGERVTVGEAAAATAAAADGVEASGSLA